MYNCYKHYQSNIGSNGYKYKQKLNLTLNKNKQLLSTKESSVLTKVRN